uniref:Uncharacterized protein n=1 Tax=Timema poppense TaxID=170557 RepID=A0A7R9CGP5_TIMPO|nr:unnamed protein product [Timema poppensis]
MLNKARSYLPVLLVVALLFSQHAQGRPYRRKRTSDQRLAEIQTYLALSKMKGEIKNVPVAFGIVDLNHIGRRRRSLKHSLKELMNSSRQESIADDVLANDPNENLNDLLTRLDQDNRAEWQYDWDIYPSLILEFEQWGNLVGQYHMTNEVSHSKSEMVLTDACTQRCEDDHEGVGRHVIALLAPFPKL